MQGFSCNLLSYFQNFIAVILFIFLILPNNSVEWREKKELRWLPTTTANKT